MLTQLLQDAKSASRVLACATTTQKNDALYAMADSLVSAEAEILAANAIDLEKAKGTTTPVMLDRLTLTPDRIADMAAGLRHVATLPDPVGNTLSTHSRPNGISIEKVSVPMGVVAMIYESRPNVTADGAALTLKSGNACVLRGGKEAHTTARAIVTALQKAVASCGLPATCVQMVEDTSRDSATALMTAVGQVDLLIPRGGAGLISACVKNALVPCIETGTGICHLYIDKDADLEKALNIVENAKTSRPSVCNAAEVLLVHQDVSDTFLPMVKTRLVDGRTENPVTFYSCPKAVNYVGIPALETSFDTEFLDYKMALKVVETAQEAVEHIGIHSTGHSDCIVTENQETANLFTMGVDSAAVYVNASTRFTDGGEFGLGCEIGISTQKLHARGPMGLEAMTSYKYIVRGNGQTR